MEEDFAFLNLDEPVQRRASRLEMIPEETDLAYKRRMAMIIQTPVNHRAEIDFIMLENEY